MRKAIFCIYVFVVFFSCRPITTTDTIEGSVISVTNGFIGSRTIPVLKFKEKKTSDIWDIYVPKNETNEKLILSIVLASQSNNKNNNFKFLVSISDDDKKNKKAILTGISLD